MAKSRIKNKDDLSKFEELEVWKPVIGYEGMYEVSSYGRAKSVSRMCDQTNIIRKVPEKILKFKVSQGGYYRVTLCNHNLKAFLVSRLVISAFTGKEIPKGMEVNHINGIKSDNSIQNLELLTPSENRKHAFQTGLQVMKKGESHHSCIYSNNFISEIKRLLKEGKKGVEISKLLNISRSYISTVKNNKHRV